MRPGASRTPRFEGSGETMATAGYREKSKIEQTCLVLTPLRDTMRKQGISDLQLARKVGVKVDVIRRAYRHMDEISLSTVEKICNVLDCGLDGVMVAKKVAVIPAHVEDPDA